MTATTALICVLCGAPWSAQAGEPRIAPCPSCGVPTTVPPPSRDVFSDELFFDGAYGGARLARTEQWLREAATRLRWVQQHVQGGTLLEIGSATGEFVTVAERAGFRATGLEASAWAAQQSARLTSSVVRADLVQWLEGQGRPVFDVVCFFHVLEHVHEPRAFLQPLVQALAPEGRMFIEVPNGAARDARDGARWLGSRLPDHVVHYREQDLVPLLESVGLRVVEVRTLTMREFDSRLVWGLRRLQWLSRGRVAPSRDFLRVVAAPA